MPCGKGFYRSWCVLVRYLCPYPRRLRAREVARMAVVPAVVRSLMPGDPEVGMLAYTLLRCERFLPHLRILML